MEYQIYRIENYAKAPLTKFDEFRRTLTIDEICKLLETDGYYNERVYNNDLHGNADSVTKIFFDIEQVDLKIETVLDCILEIFKNLGLELKKREIKYTINDKKIDKKTKVKIDSYHVTIPRYYATLPNLKYFVNEFKKYNIEIDESVYNTIWFRLPNQSGMSNGKRKEPHKIVNGKIKDFVVHYVDKTNSKNINKFLTIEKIEKVKKEKVKKENVQVHETITPSNIEDLDLLLAGLTVEWINNYLNWIHLGKFLFNIGSTVEKYIEITKRSPKFEDEQYVINKWASFKKNTYTIKSLWYWVKQCNIKYYSYIVKNKNEEKEKERINLIKIDKKYLTIEDKNKKLEIDDDLVKYFDDLLINNKYKSINIKSPYGSSKTQLIHRVIEKYQPKKILWLSFRKTLSDDIIKNFKDLNFEDYRNNKLDSDRLIIQLESLLKLEDIEEDEEINGEFYKIVHQYDLIMLDEIESLLNQFNSESTFSGKARRTFEYLEQLLKKCTNIISLDGDLENRSYHFLNHFERCLNIENLNKRNDKTLYFTDELNEFEDEIYDLLSSNKKIAIASMTSQKAEHYYKWIKNKFPDLKIGIYTGSDNTNRKDLKNVDTEWIKKDVVIYSPTITAGVSFNIENHFYKIFSVISCGSCCQRDFLQMLARIRNPIENKITVLNDGINGKLKCFFTFDEVKKSMVETRKLKVIYKDGKSKIDLDLSLFDINSIFNDVEKLNKIEPLFLEYLYKLATEKGYKIQHSEYYEVIGLAIFEQIIHNKEQNKERKEFEKTLQSKKDKLISADIINTSELGELLKKQNKQEEDVEEHFKINKSVLEKQIGLKFEINNPLTEELIKCYYNCPSSIKNFSYLIDEDNIKDIDDNFTENKRKQVFLIKEFFKDVGIEDVYDDVVFTYQQFTEKLKNKNIFKKENQIVFHTGKKAFNYTSVKEKYINTILKNYKLTFKISYNGQRIEENKIYTFTRLHHIEEIIYYKKEKNQIKDKFDLVQKPSQLIFEQFYEKPKPKEEENNDYHFGENPLDAGVMQIKEPEPEIKKNNVEVAKGSKAYKKKHCKNFFF